MNGSVYRPGGGFKRMSFVGRWCEPEGKTNSATHAHHRAAILFRCRAHSGLSFCLCSVLQYKLQYSGISNGPATYSHKVLEAPSPSPMTPPSPPSPSQQRLWLLNLLPYSYYLKTGAARRTPNRFMETMACFEVYGLAHSSWAY